ncbi:MAG: heavy metal-binding domain-containing protein [Betaproteobacteria bacterium AqS2]|uniref:UPF0145 protein ISN26_04800 n=1 Tax=Candidatus Amphirhobacter heronislandensis TaxID=1732024 RepID=A0A930XY03_9GAMM|nr:heavy metal-binding domain-containing protein [Betaproteobacteria bacterium AqS2]
MIVTTTNAIEGHRVSKYHGLVTGEAIMGANVFKDLFSNITDVIGGRSGVYERELRKAREIATEEMTVAAAELGANAVIGCDIDYEVVGGGGSMLMVTIAGTAVTVD